jgi:hypothetical protein
MIKTRKSPDVRLFYAKCDYTGLKGRWQCESSGPTAHYREEAKDAALRAGWARISNRWYCPDCQRDHLAPKPAAQTVLYEPWH